MGGGESKPAAGQGAVTTNNLNDNSLSSVPPHFTGLAVVRTMDDDLDLDEMRGDENFIREQKLILEQLQKQNIARAAAVASSQPRMPTPPQNNTQSQLQEINIATTELMKNMRLHNTPLSPVSHSETAPTKPIPSARAKTRASVLGQPVEETLEERVKRLRSKLNSIPNDNNQEPAASGTEVEGTTSGRNDGRRRNARQTEEESSEGPHGGNRNRYNRDHGNSEYTGGPRRGGYRGFYRGTEENSGDDDDRSSVCSDQGGGQRGGYRGNYRGPRDWNDRGRRGGYQGRGGGYGNKYEDFRRNQHNTRRENVDDENSPCELDATHRRSTEENGENMPNRYRRYRQNDNESWRGNARRGQWPRGAHQGARRESEDDGNDFEVASNDGDGGNRRGFRGRPYRGRGGRGRGASAAASEDTQPKYYNDECTTCLNGFEFENGRFMVLDCRHRFHNACALRWAQKATALQCPICSKEIPPTL